MGDLENATKELYGLLEKKKSMYTEGGFMKEKTLIQHKISPEAIIAAHNEGTILDVYALGHVKLSAPKMQILNDAAPRFGTPIPAKGYTLNNLPGIPIEVLYGQIRIAEKKNAGMDINMALQAGLRKRHSFPGSDALEMYETVVKQLEYSPSARIKNAQEVINGADINGIKETRYNEEMGRIENGRLAENAIIRQIVLDGAKLTTSAGNPINIGEEMLSDLKYLFSQGYRPVSPREETLSAKLEEIGNCREILINNKLKEDSIKAILGAPVLLPDAWTEIK